MEFVTLGRTKLMTTRAGVGTRLLENATEENVSAIIENAYKNGINFFDISAFSSVSKKIAHVFCEKERKNIVISVTCYENLSENVLSLTERLQQDFKMHPIDIFTVQNDDFVPLKDGKDGIYEQLLLAKTTETIKNIGFFTHKIALATEAAQSGLYDVVQFPLNLLSTDDELALINVCEKNDVGLIARMPLAGGKIEDIPIAFGFLYGFDTVVPIWSVENLEQLQKLIYFESTPPVLDERFKDDVAKLKDALTKVSAISEN